MKTNVERYRQGFADWRRCGAGSLGGPRRPGWRSDGSASAAGHRPHRLLPGLSLLGMNTCPHEKD